MKFYIKLIRFALLLTFTTTLYQAKVFSQTLQDNIVTDYAPVFFPAFDSDNKLYIAIRSYKLNNKPYFLVADPDTLRTYQKTSDSMNYRRPSGNPEDNGYIMEKEVINTTYYQALKRYSTGPYEVYNYGLKHSWHRINGVFLTIDMCPSYKPFEKNFFETLVKIGHDQKKPIPIAISMTSLWVYSHEQEFAWLSSQKWLDITWINHAFIHLYYPDVRMRDNFLNLQRTNVIEEILHPERMLISRGLTPSVFFRFPGLISSPKLIKLINELGLIPVGTDAWFAKGEEARPGSIILVHGNSNERKGIEIFMKWVEGNKLPFLPLRQAIVKQ